MLYQKEDQREANKNGRCPHLHKTISIELEEDFETTME